MSIEIKEKESKYTFNETTRKYIFHSQEKFGRNIILGEKRVNTIIELYSNYDKRPMTMGEISLKIGIPKQTIEFILKSLEVTHDTLPFTKERVDSESEEELVNEMIDNKSFRIKNSFEKLDWKRTQEDAEKWRLFNFNKFDPFSLAINQWTPPQLKSILNAKNYQNKDSDKVFVAVLSDLHFGSAANERYMFGKKSWTTQDTVKAVDRYAKGIINEVKDRSSKFKKCVVIGLGDLIHSVLGKTARGTELKYDCVREEQFEYALDALHVFFERMLEVFGEVECHDVGGNHHYELDMALFKALEMCYKKDKRLAFTHHSTRPAAFRIGSTLVMMDHGADSIERTYVPRPGNQLEKHVNTILLNNTELLNGVNTKLFIQADRHHFEYHEYSTFEFIMFSTICGADEHATTNNWHNRPRQSCMVLDDSGLREIIHFYTE